MPFHPVSRFICIVFVISMMTLLSLPLFPLLCSLLYSEFCFWHLLGAYLPYWVYLQSQPYPACLDCLEVPLSCRCVRIQVLAGIPVLLLSFLDQQSFPICFSHLFFLGFFSCPLLPNTVGQCQLHLFLLFTGLMTKAFRTITFPESIFGLAHEIQAVVLHPHFLWDGLYLWLSL